MFWQQFKKEMADNEFWLVSLVLAGASAGLAFFLGHNHIVDTKICFVLSCGITVFVGAPIVKMAKKYAQKAPHPKIAKENIVAAWGDAQYRTKSLFAAMKNRPQNRLGSEMQQLRSAILSLENIYAQETVILLYMPIFEMSARDHGFNPNDLEISWRLTNRPEERALQIENANSGATYCSHTFEDLLPEEQPSKKEAVKETPTEKVTGGGSLS